jgi:hypothetical protein
MALVDSRTGDLELSLKLYHVCDLRLGYQQSMTEAPNAGRLLEGGTQTDVLEGVAVRAGSRKQCFKNVPSISRPGLEG